MLLYMDRVKKIYTYIYINIYTLILIIYQLSTRSSIIATKLATSCHTIVSTPHKQWMRPLTFTYSYHMYAIPALLLQSITHMSVHHMGRLNRYRKNIVSWWITCTYETIRVGHSPERTTNVRTFYSNNH